MLPATNSGSSCLNACSSTTHEAASCACSTCVSGGHITSICTPSAGSFYAGFALGQKAVEAARESDLPPAVLEVIDGAQKFAEGRGVRLTVRSEDHARNVVRLAAIKMAN